jgi:hypothetical protein
MQAKSIHELAKDTIYDIRKEEESDSFRVSADWVPGFVKSMFPAEEQSSLSMLENGLQLDELPLFSKFYEVFSMEQEKRSSLNPFHPFICKRLAQFLYQAGFKIIGDYQKLVDILMDEKSYDHQQHPNLIEKIVAYSRMESVIERTINDLQDFVSHIVYTTGQFSDPSFELPHIKRTLTDKFNNKSSVWLKELLGSTELMDRLTIICNEHHTTLADYLAEVFEHCYGSSNDVGMILSTSQIFLKNVPVEKIQEAITSRHRHLEFPTEDFLRHILRTFINKLDMQWVLKASKHGLTPVKLRNCFSRIYNNFDIGMKKFPQYLLFFGDEKPQVELLPEIENQILKFFVEVSLPQEKPTEPATFSP